MHNNERLFVDSKCGINNAIYWWCFYDASFCTLAEFVLCSGVLYIFQTVLWIEFVRFE